MEKTRDINVAILGATGIIGQAFVHLLSNHKFFRIKSLIASKRRSGKKYKDEVKWVLPYIMSSSIKDRILESFNIKKLKSHNIKYIFSALPTSSGDKIEATLKAQGFFVFSNSSAHRRDQKVPILIPEVNPDSIKLIEKQGFPGSGSVITNPNCSTSGLAIAFSPLKRFGIEEITVSTYQALSGAGIPGLSAMEINDSVIPYIKDEEDKIEFETKKILGIDPKIFTTCVRVPVKYGHLESVWLKFKRIPSRAEIIENWNKKTLLKDCPTLPVNPVVYLDDPSFPRNFQSFNGKPEGMQIFTGGLKVREDKIGFNLLVNNVIRGGAGGSVANAELFHSQYGGKNEKNRS